MKQRTFEVLKNFSTINRSILIREGNLIRTMNAEKTVFAHAEVDDVFTREFAIYDLPQWLSSWSLLQEPEVSYEEDHVLLEKNGTEMKLFYSTPRHIISAPNREIALPKTIMQFELKKEVLLEMIKASSVLKLTNLYIDKNSVVCRNPDGTGNEYKCPIKDFHVGTDVDLDDDDQFNINIDAIRLIPDDYDVYVTEIALRFKSQNSVLEYFILLNN